MAARRTRVIGPGTAEVREAPITARQIDPDEGQWRPLSSDPWRDLQPMTLRRAQELSIYAWERTRIGNRLIELPIAFLIAEGVTLRVSDPKGQEWLDAFWRDPINRMGMRLESLMREMALYGHQVWPAAVREDGHVRLGYIDPLLIEKVIISPEQGEMPIVVVAMKASGKRCLFRVIYGGDEDDLFPLGSGARKLRDGATDGDAFYFRINALLNGRVGRPDLVSAIDLVDAVEETLMGEVDRGRAQRSVIWDVTIKGASEEEIRKRAAEITPPDPLSVRVHNENEVWDALAPTLNATEGAAATRMLINYLLGGATLPEHYFAEGGNVNRATAGEMAEPTFKVFTQRQKFWKEVLEDVARHVLRQRRIALGYDPEVVGVDPAWTPRAEFPELTSRDLSRYAAALPQAVAAALQAVDGGLVTEETAVRMIAAVASRLGVEIDPVAELAAAKAAREKRATEDVFHTPEGSGPEGSGGDPAAIDDGSEGA